MATYVNNLRLKEIATGAESGTWGTSTNTNLELIGEGLGFATIPNISQSMISSALDAGYLRFFRGVMALSKKENRDFIKASGATNYSQLNEMLGVSEPTSLTSGIVEKLGKYTGFTGINKINQYLAASTAGAFVKDLTKISHSGMTRTRRWS